MTGTKANPQVHVVDLTEDDIIIDGDRVLIGHRSAGGKKLYYLRTTLRMVLAKFEPRAVSR